MGKGVLLELEGRRAVVLTPQGEFVRVPLPPGSWAVGAEVEFVEQTQTRPWMRWGVAAAAAVLLTVTSTVGYNTWALAQPLAIVTVDINPSLEMTVNKTGTVLDARGLNDDGKAVLAKVEWHKRPLPEVVGAVTEQAIEAQKLNPADESGAVVVAVAPAGQKDLTPTVAAHFVADAREAAEAEVTQHAEAAGVAPAAHVTALKASAEVKREAQQVDLTPGQYLILKEIQATIPTVRPEDIKAKGPGKLVRELGINPATVFSQAEEHSDSKPSHENGDRPGTKPGESEKDRNTNPENPGKGSDKGQGKDSSGKEPGNNSGHESSKEKPKENPEPSQRPPGSGESQGNGESRGKDGKGQSGAESGGKEKDQVKDRGKSEKRSGEADTAPDGIAVQPNPRAETPGAGVPLPGGRETGGVPTQPEGEKPPKGSPETGQSDRGQSDKGQPDKGEPDKGQPDKSQSDKGQSDREQPDKGQSDKGESDRGQAGNDQFDRGQPDKGQTEKNQPDKGQSDQPEGAQGKEKGSDGKK